MKEYYVYFMASFNNTALYTGMTNNLERRVIEHKTKRNQGFTSRYNCNKLVYFEKFTSPQEAINREKQIKAGSRKKKNELVNRVNPQWMDLAKDWS